LIGATGNTGGNQTGREQAGSRASMLAASAISTVAGLFFSRENDP
jgi:hypothetical protein